jgi:hypothetical protein
MYCVYPKRTSIKPYLPLSFDTLGKVLIFARAKFGRIEG